MPGAPHESLVVLLREHPAYLRAVVEAVTHRTLPDGLAVVDAAVRVVDPAEVRLDLLLSTADGSYWVGVEVQLEVDAAKARKWPLALAALWNERGVPGDLLVVTADRSVAEWARAVGRMTGPLGARLVGEPVVLQLTGDVAEALLDPERPELAFFAAWTVHDRYGPEAVTVVERATELIEGVADEALRNTLLRLIFGMLHKKLLLKLEEASMDLDKIPTSPAYEEVSADYVRRHRAEIEARLTPALEARLTPALEARLTPALEARLTPALEARVEARVEARALLTVLNARGIAVDEARRAAVLACDDVAVLDRWITRAATATTAAEVFATPA